MESQALRAVISFIKIVKPKQIFWTSNLNPYSRKRRKLINYLKMESAKYPWMKDINIEPHGVKNFWKTLIRKKAFGPDIISNIVLKERANEIAPVLSHIFQLSIDTGELPKDWRNANVSPIFKKGDRHTVSNYRPISLTCIDSNLFPFSFFANFLSISSVVKY